MAKSIEERLEFLEKEYERIHHTLELLSLYIPKHCENFEKRVFGEHHNEDYG